jgi:hypothetical protein
MNEQSEDTLVRQIQDYVDGKVDPQRANIADVFPSLTNLPEGAHLLVKWVESDVWKSYSSWPVWTCAGRDRP